MQEAPTTCFESSSFFDFLLGFALALGTFGALTFGSFLEGMLGWLAEPPVSSDALEVLPLPLPFPLPPRPRPFPLPGSASWEAAAAAFFALARLCDTRHYPHYGQVGSMMGMEETWKLHWPKIIQLSLIESCSARISFPGGMSSKSMALRTAFKDGGSATEGSLSSLWWIWGLTWPIKKIAVTFKLSDGPHGCGKAWAAHSQSRASHSEHPRLPPAGTQDYELWAK